MVKSWVLLALATSSALSTARAACVDIDQYLSIPSPMTGDMEIDLDAVDTIECEEIGENAEVDANGLETVIVNGGTLTLRSSNNVRFVNVGFTVMSGANLVFDMPKTKFGPNTEGEHRTNYSGNTVNVEEGATATFEGQVVAKEVSNVRNLFTNAGNIEFKKRVLFQDGGNVFRDNTGIIKFRGNAIFKDNRYLALDNKDSAFVRFSKDALFDNNAFDFDGAFGCGVANRDTARVIFRGEATFQNNDCGEGVAVYNAADMTFYGKAFFNENRYRDSGGAVDNRGGAIKFKSAVQFINNTAADYGGGISVDGGDVTFSRSVTFDGNSADSGAAFAVLEGSLTFEKPDVVRFRNGETYDDDQGSDDENCLFGEVADGATLIGFAGDDVCIPSSA